MTEAKSIKIVLVEDHQMFREQLAHLITKDPQFSICGQANNIKAAMKIILAERPDIVIVDITLRGSSGLELIKDLRAFEIETPILVLSMHAEDLYAERVLRAGAKGYITKHEASTTLLKAIRQVLAGDIYLSERMTANSLAKLVGPETTPAMGGMELLTDRELEVFHWIGKGYNSREIAGKINLGETTIDTYRGRIREKLGLRNAADLYTRAAQWVRDEAV